MTQVIALPARGYKFVEGVFQYSAGVAALSGHRIERVRFDRPVPLADGFHVIADVLRSAGLPLIAFCACELRSPAPFTDDGFRAFNTGYAAVLRDWGVFADDRNPVARSNVCPAINPPETPSFHAFSYVVPSPDAPPSFVIAGSGESIEGHATYAERTVAYRDMSLAGLRLKAAHVMEQMELRMAALEFGWADTTAAQIYTVHDIYPFLPDLLIARGAGAHGLTWHYARPPVVDLEYEMDCRGVGFERVV